MKKNNKGFTLIELLAVLALLSIIMLIAIPNVLSLIDKNKRSTYIEDSKQFIALAEYKFRSDTSISRPNTNYAVAMSLKCLNQSELTNGPEGMEYDVNRSFVMIGNYNGTYKYYVTLRESNGTKAQGLNLIERSALNKSDSYREVTTELTVYDYTVGRYVKGSDGINYRIQAVCTQ